MQRAEQHKQKAKATQLPHAFLLRSRSQFPDVETTPQHTLDRQAMGWWRRRRRALRSSKDTDPNESLRIPLSSNQRIIEPTNHHKRQVRSAVKRVEGKSKAAACIHACVLHRIQTICAVHQCNHPPVHSSRNQKSNQYHTMHSAAACSSHTFWRRPSMPCTGAQRKRTLAQASTA